MCNQIDAVETDAKDLLNESSALQSEFQAIHASIMQPFEKIKRLVNKLNATQVMWLSGSDTASYC